MENPCSAKPGLLLVEDDQTLRNGLKWALSDLYRVREAATRREALAELERDDIDVVLSDLRLPPALRSTRSARAWQLSRPRARNSLRCR